MKTDTIISTGGRLSLNVSVYLIKESPGTFVAYCPSLDLTGAGGTEADARRSFGIVADEYVSYCVSNGTLAADLEAHGWRLRQDAGEAEEPAFDKMYRTSVALRDIVSRPSYKKYAQSVPC
ncbi:MAG: hypothetical protein J6M53_01160 [Bacteroidaceae bacterium]|nr:hypothetical protein [Bacteroidaceae bacterium]